MKKESRPPEKLIKQTGIMSYIMTTPSKKNQKKLGSFQVALPNDKFLEIDVSTQGDNGVIVGTSMRRVNESGGTTKYCLWCGGVFIGCVDCIGGEGVEADCIKGEIKCVPIHGGASVSSSVEARK